MARTEQSEEQRMADKQRALLGMHPQARPPEPVQQPASFLQMKPVIRNAMDEQERRAEQVVSATWKLFQNTLG
ncbi:hypothetical protein L0Y65_04155 [Candidatus Micrarchaeota archaeon]|nr:hypothetical protein [Candidatus Micrarchaeota archaeon]